MSSLTWLNIHTTPMDVHMFSQVKPPSPIKAPPVPHFGLPFQPRLPEHHQVEVCPFSFEERERERRVLKEKRLEEMRNEEVRRGRGWGGQAFRKRVLRRPAYIVV